MAKRCRNFCPETRVRCIESEHGHGLPCVYDEEQRRLRDDVYALWKAVQPDVKFYEEMTPEERRQVGQWR